MTTIGVIKGDTRSLDSSTHKLQSEAFKGGVL